MVDQNIDMQNTDSIPVLKKQRKMIIAGSLETLGISDEIDRVVRTIKEEIGADHRRFDVILAPMNSKLLDTQSLLKKHDTHKTIQLACQNISAHSTGK